ncbi:MAG: methyltransferase domain-containing protein [Ignavibacteria bacterium]|nr:methyltransferase domain-containing protein [Ignavibacteria bacterium]
MEVTNINKYFPLSSRYDINWVKKNSLGENVLYNLESLCEIINFEPGMRVLDLGSGKAISAIFLSKEFKVNVWAVDSKTCPSSNFKRIQEMNCEDKVIPLKLDAEKLPFPFEFFDVIIAVDSFMYFGKKMEFTDYLIQFLKPSGQIGIVDICYENVIAQNMGTLNLEVNNFARSLKWWSNLWNDNPNLKLIASEVVPENEIIKKEYIKDVIYSNKNDILADELSKDKNNSLNIFRMAAIKKSNIVFN